MEPDLAASVGALVHTTAFQVMEPRQGTACGAACLPGLNFNFQSEVNASRYGFDVRFPNFEAVIVAGQARIRLMALGNDEEVKAFVARLEHYPNLHIQLRHALCMDDSACDVEVSIPRVDIMGDGTRSPPGGYSRPGALAVFQLYGMNAGSLDGQFNLALEAHTADILADMSGVTDAVVSSLGCVNDVASPGRLAHFCTIEVMSLAAGDDTSRQALAGNVAMALLGGPGPDGTMLPGSVQRATNGSARAYLYEQGTTRRVRVVTRARGEFLQDTSLMNVGLGAAASNAGASSSNIPSYSWLGCSSSVSGTVCMFEFEEEGQDMADRDAAKDLNDGLAEAVTADLADRVRTALPSLGTTWRFRKLDDCTKCISGPRGTQPAGDDTYEVEFAFRNHEGAFDLEKVGEQPLVIGALAMKVAIIKAITSHDSDALASVQPYEVFFNQWFKNSDTGSWNDIDDDDVLKLGIRAQWGRPGPRNDAAHATLEGFKRQAASEAADSYNMMTGREMRTLCEPTLFKYQSKNNAGHDVVRVATNDCEAFFSASQCAGFTTINSLADGTGEEFTVLPQSALDIDDTGFKHCGCDTAGPGTPCTDNGN